MVMVQEFVALFFSSTSAKKETALSFYLISLLMALQTSREYPFSDHDNKRSFRDNISVFTQVSMQKNLGYYENVHIIATWLLERKPHLFCITVVYTRVWDAGSVFTITASKTLTSACAMMTMPTALKSLEATQYTRLTLRWSRPLTVQQPAPDGSPVITSRSLQRQLWHGQGNDSCGLDETTLSTRSLCMCWQPRTTQHHLSLKTLLHLKNTMALLTGHSLEGPQVNFLEGPTHIKY